MAFVVRDASPGQTSLPLVWSLVTTVSPPYPHFLHRRPRIIFFLCGQPCFNSSISSSLFSSFSSSSFYHFTIPQLQHDVLDHHNNPEKCCISTFKSIDFLILKSTNCFFSRWLVLIKENEWWSIFIWSIKGSGHQKTRFGQQISLLTLVILLKMKTIKMKVVIENNQ